MQSEVTGQKLQPGQLWRLEHGYMRIVEVGDRLVHYKTLRQPDQRAAVTRMISVGALLKYLSHCEGQLMSSHLNPGRAALVPPVQPVPRARCNAPNL